GEPRCYSWKTSIYTVGTPFESTLGSSLRTRTAGALDIHSSMPKHRRSWTVFRSRAAEGARMASAIGVRRRNRRAVIIGGSMSGLFVAAFLRQKGWDADVYERSAVELVGRGAGITTHPELLDALEKSGAGTRGLGVEVEKRIALDRDGRVIGQKYLPQLLTSWDRLQRLLRAT